MVDMRGRIGLGSRFGGTKKASTGGAEKNAELNLISIKLDVLSTHGLNYCPPRTIPKVAIGMYETSFCSQPNVGLESRVQL